MLPLGNKKGLKSMTSVSIPKKLQKEEPSKSEGK